MGGVNPGIFRDVIHFSRLDRTATGGGGTNGQFDFYFETFANITTMKPITDFTNGKLTVIQMYSVIIRHGEDREIDADMQVTFDGNRYLIKNIFPVDTKKSMLKFWMVKS